MRLHAFSSIALVLSAVVATPAHAQRKASELATMSQVVDGTTMKMEYYRPVARGRELFGKLVRWGSTWTPGANWATTFETDKDVQINGNLVPAGKYAIWMIPRESEDWTVIFHRKARAFHTERPKQDDELFRFAVKPEQGAHMETLMWYFPVIGPDSATLRMHWGTTAVAMQVAIRPTVVAMQLEPSVRAMYVGGYSWEADWAKGAQVEVSDSTGRLILAIREPKATEPISMDLVPLGEHRFRTGRAIGGQVVDLSSGSIVTFTVEGGRVVSFEMKDSAGKVEGKGARLK